VTTAACREGIGADRDIVAAVSRGPSIPRVTLMHMKRTNLVLDDKLLEDAVRLSGERTYSRAVERALRDFVQRANARRILDLAGSGLWEGDLSVVREDRGVYRTKRRGAR
jgi:Arc/MetJ family transcription regulator